jgi:putative tricarboxylic transport membrane protein
MMHLRSIKEFYSGVALALFGLYVAGASWRFDYLSEEGPGPGFLPFWLGIAIFALAVVLIVSTLRHLPPHANKQPQSWFAESRALFAWLALMGAIFLSPVVGFTVSLMLLTIFIIAYMERRSMWSAMLVALGLGIGFHVVFVVVLGLSLPVSPLGF